LRTLADDAGRWMTMRVADVYRQRVLLVGVALAAAIFHTAPAWAADPALLSFGVGKYDQDWIDPGVGFLDLSDDQTDEAIDFRLEYRFGTSLLPIIEPYVKLKPFVGLEATSDAAVYGLGGILFDIALGPVMVTPSIGVGLYHDGDGKDLGSAIEFRTQLEIGYRFENDMRVSVAYSHISNAGIGSTNPGANLLGLYFHTPVSTVFNF
jgi:lipid A 3-O-deacylase